METLFPFGLGSKLEFIKKFLSTPSKKSKKISKNPKPVLKHVTNYPLSFPPISRFFPINFENIEFANAKGFHSKKRGGSISIENCSFEQVPNSIQPSFYTRLIQLIFRDFRFNTQTISIPKFETVCVLKR